MLCGICCVLAKLDILTYRTRFTFPADINKLSQGLSDFHFVMVVWKRLKT